MNLTSNRTRTYDWQASLTHWDAIHQMSGKDFLQSILDGQHHLAPMSQTMNMHLTEIDDGYAVYTIEPAEYHYNPIGSVHGGLAATIFDEALASAIFTQLPAGSINITVELHVHYLRALTVDSGRIRCEANAIHVGRTLATAGGQLVGEADGKIYAHATLTSLVRQAPQGDVTLPKTHDTRTISWEDPMIGARAGMQSVGIDYLHAIAQGNVPSPPIVKLLGLSGIHTVEDGRVRFGARLGGWQMNKAGLIHGGLTATLCDSALGCAIHSQMPQGTGYTTAELNVNYVRPITPDIQQIYADATILHAGKQIATAETRVIDESGTLYAHATTTCLVFPMRS